MVVSYVTPLITDGLMCLQIDLRKESIVKIVAEAPFPVITFGPFPTPQALMTSLSHAIGTMTFDHMTCLICVTFNTMTFVELLLMKMIVAGTMQMPPKWALGYQQCRWSYMTAARVAEVQR